MRWMLVPLGLLLAGLTVVLAVDAPAAAQDSKKEEKKEDKKEKKEEKAEKGGTITGTVTGRPRRYLKKGVIVYVENVEGKFPAPKKHAVVDQKDMKFVPHIQVILAGTTVDFLNSDPVAHNVFSPDGEKYNLGTWPKGETKSYTFKRTGVYTQLCHVHPEMEGFIVVLQNPYFARADEKGTFKISNVPPGTYHLVAWNERMAPGREEVKVTAAGTTKVDFKLKRK